MLLQGTLSTDQLTAGVSIKLTKMKHLKSYMILQQLKQQVEVSCNKNIA